MFPANMLHPKSECLRKKMKRKFQQVILEINEKWKVLSSPAPHSYSNPNSVISVRGYFDSSNNSEQYKNLQSPQNLVSDTQNETESTLSPITQQLPSFNSDIIALRTSGIMEPFR